MIQRISPDQARLGMFVTSVGGSWLSHPFWRSRFKLTSQREVDRLRTSSAEFVEIDTDLGFGPVEKEATQLKSGRGRVGRIGENVERSLPRKALSFAANMNAEFRAEHARANRTVARAKSVVSEIFSAARLGKDVPVAQALALVAEINRLFDRGEHLLIEMVRMKTADEYTHLHSVAVCALMLRFARHLEMTEAEIRECGLAGLMHDVGKMHIPSALLHKPGALEDDEFELIRSHVTKGHSILKGVASLPAGAVEVAHLHHERIDGSGYPFGLSGEQIPQIARMAAICDVYDALTSNRSYKKAWLPAQAMQEMLALDNHFDGELTQKFAESIDIFNSLPQSDQDSERLAKAR